MQGNHSTISAGPTAVYVARHKGSRRLLYIGVTSYPLTRMKQHSDCVPDYEWARHAVYKWYWFRTRREALAVEAKLCQRFQPPYNRTHTWRGRRFWPDEASA